MLRDYGGGAVEHFERFAKCDRWWPEPDPWGRPVHPAIRAEHSLATEPDQPGPCACGRLTGHLQPDSVADPDSGEQRDSAELSAARSESSVAQRQPNRADIQYLYSVLRSGSDHHRCVATGARYGRHD